MEWLVRFQQIDRRIIYALVILSIVVALLWPFDLPQPVTPEVEKFYRAVEEVPEDKIVLVAADWGAGTRGENRPQTEATIRHLFLRKKKFAIMGFDLQGPQFAQALAEKWAKEYGAEYGKDWCNWGYQPVVDAFLISLVQNIPKAVPRDIQGTPIEQIPMMQGVKNIYDVGLVAEFTGAGLLQSYLRRLPREVPIVQGCTAIIGPEQYTYLDAGQIKGLLVGMRGAAEYEKLLNTRGEGRNAMRPQSLTHLLMIGLILLGNLALWAQRRSLRRR